MSINLSLSVFYWAGSQTAIEIWKSLEIQTPAIQLSQDQPQFQTTRINMGPSLYVQLYILRNIQLLFTVIYIVLMVYAAINPGRWLDLKEPLGLTPRPFLYFPDAVLMSGAPTYIGFGCKFYSLQILLPQSLLLRSNYLLGPSQLLNPYHNRYRP